MPRVKTRSPLPTANPSAKRLPPIGSSRQKCALARRTAPSLLLLLRSVESTAHACAPDSAIFVSLRRGPAWNHTRKNSKFNNNSKERITTMKESKSISKDPICGMTVDEATALHAERDGKTFYFCSDHCRQKLLSAPAGAKPGEKLSCCCG